MAFGHYYKLNNIEQNSQLNFTSKGNSSVAAPVQSLQTSLEQGIDNFATKINEKKDKKEE